MRPLNPLVLATLLLVSPGPSPAQDQDPFVGRFHHSRMDLELAANASGYDGWLIVEGEQYEVMAQRGPRGLVGSFRLQGHYYDFTGKASKNGLTLWLPIGQTPGEVVWRLGEFKPVRYEFRRVVSRENAPQSKP